MPSDLEAALREAREALVKIGVPDGCWPEDDPQFAAMAVVTARKALARIDAALSAASGAASRPTIYERDGVFDDYQGPDNPAASGEASDKWEIDAHAPSEAPNVERARDLVHEAVTEIRNGASVRAVIRGALDSARAEGIAAMRECAVKIALGMPVPDEFTFLTADVFAKACAAVAAAIREAKL